MTLDTCDKRQDESKIVVLPLRFWGDTSNLSKIVVIGW
jgi:hypothetical protein